jgi:hypothetical protein
MLGIRLDSVISRPSCRLEMPDWTSNASTWSANPWRENWRAERLTQTRKSAEARVLEAPLLNLCAGLGKAPVADREDQTALLRQGNEIHGRNQPPVRMLPPDERLDSHDLARRRDPPQAGSTEQTGATPMPGADPACSANSGQCPRLRRSCERAASRAWQTLCAACGAQAGWPPCRPGSPACEARSGSIPSRGLAAEYGEDSQDLVFQ